MTATARFIPVRIGKLLACVLLQMAFLLAVSPASASLGLPCHHHGHATHAVAEHTADRHAEADHPSSPACDHCGRCPACCLGGCTAACLSPSGCIGVAAALFRTVGFAPVPSGWSPGQGALPPLPPPRRIA